MQVNRSYEIIQTAALSMAAYCGQSGLSAFASMLLSAAPPNSAVFLPTSYLHSMLTDLSEPRLECELCKRLGLPCKPQPLQGVHAVAAVAGLLVRAGAEVALEAVPMLVQAISLDLDRHDVRSSGRGASSTVPVPLFDDALRSRLVAAAFDAINLHLASRPSALAPCTAAGGFRCAQVAVWLQRCMGAAQACMCG